MREIYSSDFVINKAKVIYLTLVIEYPAIYHNITKRLEKEPLFF